MSRRLGETQLALLDVLGASGRLTVAELAERLGLAPRRCRKVVRSLAARRLLDLSRQQIGTQSSGLPIHGLVVWSVRAAFRRDADRATAARYAERLALTSAACAEHEARPVLCPRCGQPWPRGLSVPPGAAA